MQVKLTAKDEGYVGSLHSYGTFTTV